MTEKYKGKVSIYPEHVDVYGEVNPDYVTDLAKIHLSKIKNKEATSSGVFSEKQELMMHALPKELKKIMIIVKNFNKEHKDWPTQANIRDELSTQIENCSDVYCKRKIDELEKQEFVVTTKKSRGKKIMFSKIFRELG